MSIRDLIFYDRFNEIDPDAYSTYLRELSNYELATEWWQVIDGVEDDKENAKELLDRIKQESKRRHEAN